MSQVWFHSLLTQENKYLITMLPTKVNILYFYSRFYPSPARACAAKFPLFVTSNVPSLLALLPQHIKWLSLIYFNFFFLLTLKILPLYFPSFHSLWLFPLFFFISHFSPQNIMIPTQHIPLQNFLMLPVTTAFSS